MKWLKRTGVVLAALILMVIIWMITNVRNRHAGYSLDLTIEAPEAAGQLFAGFAAVPITPTVVDTWIDANGDARYQPLDGDVFEDGNGNGMFDPVWIAGFHNRRPANGIHDDLWARVMIIDDGQTRLAVVALDAIGFFHDDVIDIRKMIPPQLEIDYAIVCSTHDHEAPDLLGLWGGGWFKSGVDPDYMAYVKSQTVKAVERAVQNLRPAVLRFAQDLTSAAPFVEDSRKPIVLDPGVRLMHAVDAEADTILGTLMAWANHPETMWSRNLLISSDYPHYVRKFMEEGVSDGETMITPGIGGTVVYLNGAIGGLMTTSPRFGIAHRFEDTTYTSVSFAKARAQGQQIATVALNALKSNGAVELRQGGITLRARTIAVPLDNKIFRLALALGIIGHGFERWMEMRTEVAVFSLGPASFIAVPGEIYPEIINGGIEAPPGQDYVLQPMEVPPLRELMPGRFKFVFGLANDEIGYIIPKSEWDTDTPYLYNAISSPYGEINSLGPETAPVIHREISDLLLQLMSDQ